MNDRIGQLPADDSQQDHRRRGSTTEDVKRGESAAMIQNIGQLAKVLAKSQRNIAVENTVSLLMVNHKDEGGINEKADDEK